MDLKACFRGFEIHGTIFLLCFRGFEIHGDFPLVLTSQIRLGRQMNLEILSATEVETLRRILGESLNIVICGHKSPDGDALGASLAWANFLEGTGKTTTVVMPDAYPDFLQWLPGTDRILRYDKKREEVEKAFAEADLVCCLDFNDTSRTEDLQEVLDTCQARKILIDHHLKPNIDAVLKVSHPEMSSTCEMVFDIISQLGGYGDMTVKCATCLYCGMMTDTGSFTYNSSRPEIFYVISMLLAKGINKDNIYKRIYHTCSISCLRMRSYVIYRKMRVMEELRAAYFTLTKDEMRRFRFIKGDAEGLVNEPLKIRGMRLSISLREDTERQNLVLVSLRSSCGFHCESMARDFFNGGGHEDAAGGRLFCSMEEAEQITINAILAYKSRLKQ